VTRDEASQLAVFLGEFREFRQDDREWKKDIDKRLRLVETFTASRRAVVERDAAQAAAVSMSRRAYVASAVAAIGIVASLLLGIFNRLA